MTIIINIIGISKGEDALKTAIKKEDLKGSKYILCKSVLVTGFNWLAVEDEKGKMPPTYCIITGADPQSELKLSYEFMSAGNTFIFYVNERKEYYSEELKEKCVEYIVDGWDILYPIKKGVPWDYIVRRKYITKNDVE